MEQLKGDDIPETYSMFGWMTVGRTYFEDLLEVYPSAELKVLPGAGNGLHGQDAETATEYMLEYLQAHCR